MAYRSSLWGVWGPFVNLGIESSLARTRSRARSGRDATDYSTHVSPVCPMKPSWKRHCNEMATGGGVFLQTHLVARLVV